MSNDINNRAARRSSSGRHRKVQNQATVALVAAAAVAAGLALAPSAGAAPTQGGTTGAGTQGGTVGAGAQGGTTTAPAPAPASVPEAPAQAATWVETPQAYAPENVQWRAMPNYDYETETYVAPEYTYVAPVQIETLHLPVAVTPTAPIIAPRNKVRFGDAMFEQANWMSDVDAERTNNTSAILEAQATDFWRSVGVETTRAERLAASQVAGGVTGAVAGATAVGVPAAVVGGLIGGTVGGVQGAALGTIIPTPIPGLPVVTNRRQPMELQRQVQIGAGSLAFVGTLLGLFVSPWFLAVPAFVGAGLITAGVTGFCGMARILRRAPWNRGAYGSPARAGS